MKFFDIERERLPRIISQVPPPQNTHLDVGQRLGRPPTLASTLISGSTTGVE
jgi:hypothetical protein